MKSKAKIGRRTLCTSEITKALCEYVSNACTLRTAAEAVGISLTSIHEWVRRGEAGEKPFAQFAQSLVRARGLGKAKLVKSIVDSGDPRVLLEYLGRVYANEYARTASLVVERQPPLPQPVVEQPPEKKLTVKWLVKDADIFTARQLRSFMKLRDHANSMTAGENREVT